MKKKVFIILLGLICAVFIGSFTSCDSDDDDSGGGTKKTAIVTNITLHTVVSEGVTDLVLNKGQNISINGTVNYSNGTTFVLNSDYITIDGDSSSYSIVSKNVNAIIIKAGEVSSDCTLTIWAKYEGVRSNTVEVTIKGGVAQEDLGGGNYRIALNDKTDYNKITLEMSKKYKFTGEVTGDGFTTLMRNIPTSIMGEAIEMDFSNCTLTTYLSTYRIISSNAMISSLSLPQGLRTLSSYFASDNWKLKRVTIPNSVTSIEESAFSGCRNLTNITIPDGVTSIGKWAFQDCQSLTSISIPDSVTSIGAYAFKNCTALSYIYIPSSVKSMGGGVFDGWRSTQTITITWSENKPTGWNKNWYSNYCKADISIGR